MSEALIEALADACWANTCECDVYSPSSVIRFVLALPQMQAIKRALLDAASEFEHGGRSRGEALRHSLQLPDDVIEWVLS